MNYEINGIKYPVIIIKKNNKNTYLRITDDFGIQVTTSYFVTKKQIEKILGQNESILIKMLETKERKLELQNKFYYLGKEYNVIEFKSSNLEMIGNNFYISSQKELEKWLIKQIKIIFLEHFDMIYNIFEENIPYPKLRFRKMKTRWGVCNRKNLTITLNTDLIRYDLEKLDYVIIHELSHLIEFNHSSNFWKVVSKYCPNYKQIRKELKY